MAAERSERNLEVRSLGLADVEHTELTLRSSPAMS
jgi:hypothetical protein